MLHRIPIPELEAELGAWAEPMTRAISACVHCGFCLPTCPTYSELGEETDSPRGRIVLMKGALEGELEPAEVAAHVDACLGCVACVSSCPSGVRYGELVTPFRAWLEDRRARPLSRRLWRTALLHTVPHPKRFATLLRLVRPLRRLRRLAPRPLRAALELVPAAGGPERGFAGEALAPIGEGRGPVVLLTSCAHTAVAPDLDETARAVLEAFGFEVLVPERHRCCGALALHSGALALARAQARETLAAIGFTNGPVVTSAAGCGSALREFPLLLAETRDAEEAEALAQRATDLCTLLSGALGDRPLPRLADGLRVVYHDPCHLRHAQQEQDSPRRLLRAIPGLEVLEAPEPEICCGSAGLYNLEQPAMASRLGSRKAESLVATGAEAVATANIGCALQLRAHLQRLGRELPVVHVVELVARALGPGH